jgi:hypothetical protein
MSASNLPPHTRAFLAAFIESGGRVSKAAEAANISRDLHYRRYRASPEYKAIFDLAKEEAAQILEDEAVERAKEGTLRPVFYKGKPCGAIREKSDTLLMFLLKGARPSVYRERHQIDLNANVVATKFKGSMAELLATFREMTTEQPEE